MAGRTTWMFASGRPARPTPSVAALLSRMTDGYVHGYASDEQER